MIYQVVSASLGYNERVYSKGNDINVDTPGEVKRLTELGVIEESPVATPELHSSSTAKTVVEEQKAKKRLKTHQVPKNQMIMEKENEHNNNKIKGDKKRWQPQQTTTL